MQSLIRKLKIHTLKMQLQASRAKCDSLAIEFEAAATTEQKAELAQRWNRAIEENHAAQHALAILERDHSELPVDADG
jgi:hypothetical protein